jgi:hypothetical protein
VHGKVFTFRAPAAAVETLRHLGVNCVTLENNHALDYGPDALQDTLAYPREAGIAYAGAGEDVEEARAPAVVRGLPIVGRRWSTVWRGSRMAKKGSVAALPASVCRLDKYCRNGGMAFAHHHGVGLPGVHDGDHGPFRRSLENATLQGEKPQGPGSVPFGGSNGLVSQSDEDCADGRSRRRRACAVICCSVSRRTSEAPPRFCSSIGPRYDDWTLPKGKAFERPGFRVRRSRVLCGLCRPGPRR